MNAHVLKKPALITLVVVLFLAATAALLTPVTTGDKIVCKYNHVVKTDVGTRYVFRWDADESGVKVTTIVCARHRRLEALQRQALEALKKGDKDGARRLFEEIKAADPNFGDVNTQLARLDEADAVSGGTPGNPSDPGSPGSPGSPPAPPPTPSDLVGYLPASLDGFTTGLIDQGAGFASRQYHPKSPTRMLSLLITVHQTGGQSASEEFVARVDKAGFPRNGRIMNVNGYAAYFGTDAGTYATLAWAQGAIVVEIQAHASSGNPADLVNDLVTVAAQVK